MFILAQKIGESPDTLDPGLCGFPFGWSSRGYASREVNGWLPLWKEILEETSPQCLVVGMLEAS